MKIGNRKLVDMVLLSFNGCIHYAKLQVDKPKLEASTTKKPLKLY